MHPPYPFDLKVFVYRRPHMRDPMLEYELHLGMPVLRNLFDEERVDPAVISVSFSFPERWLNIVEERSLFGRIARYYPNMRSVRLRTQSVYIVQSTPAESCYIAYGGEEQVGAGLPQEGDAGRLWFRVEGTLVGDGLTVLT
jgi:hypothetical protein